MELSEVISMLQAGRYAELAIKIREALRIDPDSGVLWKALSIASSQQGENALPASQRAAALLPADAEAHVNLGDALLRGARFEEAAVSYRRALELGSRHAATYNNLGNALRGLGRPAEAMESYAQAIETNASFAEGYNNLANVQRSLGRLDEAIASYQRALQVRPRYPEAWNNLGNALLDLAQFENAALCYRSALDIDAQFAEAHANLGNALRSLGRLDESEASYRRALALRAGFAAAHSNLGDVLRDLGRLAEAAASCERAVQLAPDCAGPHNSLGNVMMDQGRLDEAEAAYRRALKLDPRFAAAAVNLGLLLRQRGRAADAEGYAQAALDAKPAAAPAHVLLAELHADRGEFAAAERAFNHAVTLDPQSAEGWAGIAHLRRMTHEDAAWAEQAQSIARLPLPPKREIYLRFAIGKYFDDVKDYAQAFQNFERAHDLARSFVPAYDPERYTQAVDHVIATYDAAWARDVALAPAGATPGSERAVFIVGMPRSGTTLAEQILASHPEVHGCGELSFWSDAARSFYEALDAGQTRSAAAMRLGAEYLELLRGLSPDAARAIDKMPANFWCLGSIHEALPGARIIHMLRDPIDTCLSIYFQHFKNVLPYANDLRDLAHFFAQYRRLMDHWRVTLPGTALLEVSYENLVGGQETCSRKMLDFIGMPWDARCLEFHRTRRSVLTASKWQVRQKLHGASIERWRNYEPFIAALLPLLAAL